MDSQFSHAAWRDLEPAQGGIGKIGYPLVADLTKDICRDYDVLVEDAGVALRGTFLIDKEGVVQHENVNNLGLGRNIDEILRLVDALQCVEGGAEVCPAGWTPGKPGMKPTPEGMKEFLAAHADEM